MRAARSLLVVVALSSFLPLERAAAQDVPPPVHVELDASADTCLDRTALLTATMVRVGRDPFAPLDRAAVRITVRVAARPGGVDATLEAHGREDGAALGERVIEIAGDDCTRRTATLSLVLAMMIESARERARLREPSLGLPARTALGPEASLAIGASTGLYGALAPSFALGVAVPIAPPIRARLRFEIVRTIPVEGPSGVDVLAARIELAGCGSAAVDAIGLGGCLGIGGGPALGTGRDLGETRSAVLAELDAMAGAELRFPAGGVIRGGLELGMRIPLVFPRFVSDDGAGRLIDAFPTWPIAPFLAIWIEIGDRG